MNEPFAVQLVLGDEVLLTSYSSTAPFVPRSTDKIVQGFSTYRVLEVHITYLIPTGMNAIVYLEKL